jgi:hypothetical protein
MTFLYTILGLFTQRTLGINVARWKTILSVLVPVVGISIWAFTTPNDLNHIADNVTTVVYWFIYMILYVIIPLIVGEVISALIRPFFENS